MTWFDRKDKQNLTWFDRKDKQTLIRFDQKDKQNLTWFDRKCEQNLTMFDRKDKYNLTWFDRKCKQNLTTFDRKDKYSLTWFDWKARHAPIAFERKDKLYNLIRIDRKYKHAKIRSSQNEKQLFLTLDQSFHSRLMRPSQSDEQKLTRFFENRKPKNMSRFNKQSLNQFNQSRSPGVNQKCKAAENGSSDNGAFHASHRKERRLQRTRETAQLRGKVRTGNRRAGDGNGYNNLPKLEQTK